MTDAKTREVLAEETLAVFSPYQIKEINLLLTADKINTSQTRQVVIRINDSEVSNVQITVRSLFWHYFLTYRVVLAVAALGLLSLAIVKLLK